MLFIKTKRNTALSIIKHKKTVNCINFVFFFLQNLRQGLKTCLTGQTGIVSGFPAFVVRTVKVSRWLACPIHINVSVFGPCGDSCAFHIERFTSLSFSTIPTKKEHKEVFV